MTVTVPAAAPGAGSDPDRPVRPVLLAAALFLAALNLRAAMSSVPPLLDSVRRDVGLSGVGAGALTTLPVLCMGLFAPAAQRLAARIGREAAVAVALAVLTSGLALRALGVHPAALFGGTLLAGVGIAICGVVLPGIVKEHFASRAGAVTGLYMTSMMLGATVAAGASVPLAGALGSWPAALAVWSLVGVVGLVGWLPVAARAHRPDRRPRVVAGRLPWRSRTAWLVSAYLAIQSVLFYSQLAWLAPAYEAAGWRPGAAGLLLAVFTVTQLGAALTVPALADRTADRRPWFYLVVGASLIGMTALLAAPEVLPWVFVAVLGFGQGGGFALGLVLLVDYAPDPATAGRLAAMAFLVCYLLAALGPIGVGGLHDLTGGYPTGWAVLLCLDLAQLAVVWQLSPARRSRGL